MSEPNAPSSRRPRFSSYEWRLLVFLSVATFFEGYDFFALAQILPSLRADFDLSRGEAGILYGIVNLGTLLAYVLVRRADRWGRRRVLSLTIAGYTISTFLSGLAPEAVSFTLLQLVARTFLIGEYCISMVYAAEEFPAARRGFVVGLIQAFSSLGAIFCAAVTPVLLSTPVGWRSVYFAGIIPLALLAYLRRNLRESRRFEADVKGRTSTRSIFHVWHTPHRRRILQLGIIWSLTYACTNTVVAYFKEYAVSERGFSDGEVGAALSIAAIVAMPLVFLAGRIIDVLGRRRGALLVFSVFCAGVVGTYLSESRVVITASLVFATFGVSAVLAVLNAYGSELFPTEIRADSYAWANNLIGRVGYVIGPVVVGLAADTVGWGPAVTATAGMAALALVLILTLLPETGSRELEETASLEGAGS